MAWAMVRQLSTLRQGFDTVPVFQVSDFVRRACGILIARHRGVPYLTRRACPMRARTTAAVLTAIVLTFLAVAVHPAEAGRRHGRATIVDLLDLDVKPFAIGHRGFGENMG